MRALKILGLLPILVPMSQGLILYALFVITGFGALSIALLGVAAARRRDRAESRNGSRLMAIDEAMALHRSRMNAQNGPAWEGRDLGRDAESPWRPEPGSSATPVR